jgi:solute carrier family 8 (sodium/calcium exchanger)
LGVFAITTLFSLWAYIWLYIVLEVSSPNAVTIPEAVVTFVLFFILIICAYAADKYNDKKNAGKDGENKDHKPNFSIEDFYHILAVEKAKELKGETDKGDKKENKGETSDHTSMKKFLKDAFNTDDIRNIDPQEVEKVLKPQSMIPRLQFRKQFANKISGRRDFVVVKGMKHQQEENLAKDMHAVGELNDKIGFKCLHYSVTESAGTIKVVVQKKVDEEIKFGARTKDDTASVESDYKAMDKVFTLGKDDKEAIIEVEIVDDEQWEPDRDFLIEIYDVDTKEKLFGADAETRITIIDDDQPGNLCFKDRNVKVTSKDKFAHITVSRTGGCDGVVKCKFETENATTSVGNTATPYEDYLPKSGVLVFNHQETEKEI